MPVRAPVGVTGLMPCGPIGAGRIASVDMGMLVLLGLDVLVCVVEIIRVNVRVLTARVAVHVQSRMNRPVRGQEDRRQGGREGAHASAQRVHPRRRVPQRRTRSQQTNEKNPRTPLSASRNTTGRWTRRPSTAGQHRLPLPGHFFITAAGDETMRRLSLLDMAVILAVLALLLFVARLEFGHYRGGTFDPHPASAPARPE